QQSGRDVGDVKRGLQTPAAHGRIAATARVTKCERRATNADDVGGPHGRSDRGVWRQLEIYWRGHRVSDLLGASEHLVAARPRIRSLSIHLAQSRPRHDYWIASANHHDVAKPAVGKRSTPRGSRLSRELE